MAFLPTRGRRRCFMPFCALVCLTACAVPPAAAPVAAAAPPTDPILQAVAAGAVGAPLVVGSAGGGVSVSVMSDYISAAGHECRTYVVAPSATLRLACDDGGAWRNIPPLEPGAGTVAVP